jgi:hypothetical protein
VLNSTSDAVIKSFALSMMFELYLWHTIKQLYDLSIELIKISASSLSKRCTQR